MTYVDLSRVVFREMRADLLQDLDDYESLVIPGMEREDTQLRAEFESRLADGRVRAWWAQYEDRIAGWCALAPLYRKYHPDAAHLYGTWVRQDLRRQGLANLMWRHRLGFVPLGTPVTASIQSGTHESRSIARRFGFEEISAIGSYVIYLRKPS